MFESICTLEDVDPARFELSYQIHKEAFTDIVIRYFGSWEEEEHRAIWKEKHRFVPRKFLVSDNTIIGLLGLAYDGDTCFLDYIAISSEQRNKGWGTRILKHLIEVIKERDHRLSLSVLSGSKAVPLYKRLGFEVFDIHANKLKMEIPHTSSQNSKLSQAKLYSEVQDFDLRVTDDDTTQQFFSEHKKAFRYLVEKHYKHWDEKWQWEHWKTKIKDSPKFVIAQDSHDIGMISVIDRGVDILLEYICIAEKHRGKGVGSKIIRSLQGWAVKHGRPLRLAVLEGNDAIILYRRLGFEVEAVVGIRRYMVFGA